MTTFNVTAIGQKYKVNDSELTFSVKGFQCENSTELFDSLYLAQNSNNGQIYVAHNKGQGVHKIERTMRVGFK